MRKFAISIYAVFTALCGLTAVFYIVHGWEQTRYGGFILIELLAMLFGFAVLAVILTGFAARALPKVRRRGTGDDILLLCCKLLCAMQVFPIVGGYLLSGYASGGTTVMAAHIVVLAGGMLVLRLAAPRLVPDV